MTKSTNTATRPACEIHELQSNHRLASAYAKAAVESLNTARTRATGLFALRSIAEAYGGLSAVAAKAGITRATLLRSLSSKGNPRMKVIEAVLKPMGLSLSVVPQQKKARKRVARKPAKAVRVRAAA
jgi:DNA-binding phage protein